MGKFYAGDIIIKKERDMCIGLAFASLSLRHRLLLRCYVLREITPRQIIKRTRMVYYPARQKELAVAVQTLCNRYLALYERDAAESKTLRI